MAVNDSVSITADSLDGEMSLVIDDTASLGSADAGMLTSLFHLILLLTVGNKMLQSSPKQLKHIPNFHRFLPIYSSPVTM